jgi:hypothetical protein
VQASGGACETQLNTCLGANNPPTSGCYHLLECINNCTSSSCITNCRSGYGAPTNARYDALVNCICTSCTQCSGHGLCP